MKKLLMLFKTLVLIFFLPLELIYTFCIKPIFLFIVRSDINSMNDKYEDLLKSYRIKNKENENSLKKIESQNKRINRLESILEFYKDYKFEIEFTKEGETVLIFSSKKGKIDSFYLCGLDGCHGRNDCRIYLINGLHSLKIVDVISNTRNRGYARTLLEFVIQKAKDNQIKKICGDLSSVDSDEFGWLIPFYESLGFECELFKDTSTVMDGKMEMTLN
ncbi:GNAT family N-acetyltransferase [Marinifilum flexuosum]|uniref:GNAT family N-acetyltransferase n=1 Tax=Marinifilum flexuosum TaxID=1117708 RepID=UPI00249344A7|nr:GNAT family N-acetyltransferase [Marinifilum flexuosum]